MKATSFPSGGGTVTGTNVDATKQSSEPNHGGNAGGKSVWWNWTAPGSGSVTLSTSGSDFDTLLGVYTGPNVSNLSVIGSSDDIGLFITSELAFAAVSGTTYRIAVDGWADPDGGTADSGNISLTLTMGGSRPANDDFASAAVIPGAGGAVNGTNVNATREGGEPVFADNSGERSVWWTWTPSQSGHALIETAGSSFDTLLGVFTGSSVGSLTLVGESDDAGDLKTSSVLVSVTSGTTYRIAVDGWAGETGSISLTAQVLQVSAPGNDDFADAFTIPGAGGDTTGANIDATKETGEPAHAGNAGGHSVWWKWTAPGDGTATISTSGSNYDTLLAVYTGNAVGTLTEVAASDDDGGFTTSRVEFAAVSGTTYRIAVDGWGGAVGSVSLSTQFAPSSAPGNDAFASAFTLTGSSDSTTGANFAATKESGEPAHAGNAGGHSVWWSWTAPTSGTATISTTGSSFDTLLGVYTGANVGALSEIASSNDDGGMATSRVEFATEAGTTYRIAVDGAGGAVGSISLSVLLVVVSPPENDAFSAASVFPAEGGNTIGTNTGATKETGEPAHAGNAGGKSVWWTWTPSVSGTATINTTGSNFDTLLAVYTGAGVGSLTVVASSDDDGDNSTSLVEFAATAGTAYRIAVDGFDDGSAAASGQISLTVVNVPPPPAAPVAGAATSITTSGFTANWSASAGATGYRLDVSTSNAFANYVTGYQDLDVGNATNRAVSGLDAGTTYYYRVRAHSDSGTSANSGTITVATSTPPPPSAPVAGAATSITTSGFTANWSASAGATGYRLDVSASNTFANYVAGYQDLDAGNATNRVVSGLSAGSTYYYRVRAYNDSGTSANSGTITVATSNPPPVAPTITTDPTSLTVTAGQPASFTVAAAGTAPLSYQWRKGGVNIGGATSATYNIAATVTGDAGSYDCVVTNSAGSATSNAATLTVTALPVAPTITTHPSSLTVTAGQSAGFSVAATGTAPLSYQWRKGGVNIGGATSATYNIAATVTGDAGNYDCVVTNSAGSATSNAATLTVNPAVIAPTVTTHPSSLTVTAGQPASFTIAATGTAPLSYQWRKDGVNIGGATSATYNIAATVTGDAGNYDCVVTNSAGSATSNAATLTVNPAVIAPTITTHPSSVTVIEGQQASFTVVATGTAPFSYQWRKGGANISGATSATYTLNAANALDAGTYSVVVTNSAGSATSNNATLAVNVPPSITTHPSSQTVAAGAAAGFTVAATGTAPLSYQWRKNGVNISGATSATYNIASASTGDAGGYSCVVTNVAGSATSNSAALTVNVPPSITAQPADRTAVIGSDVTFSVTATGTSPLSYQWKRNGVNVGTNSDTLVVADVQPGAGATYTCVVTNVAGSAMSNPATLALDTTPRLINVSCLASAGSGDSTLVVGFYVNGTGKKTLLIRGIGPRLASDPFNRTSFVADPQIRVYDKDGVLIASNDDWDSSLAPDFERMGAFGLVNGSKDAALKVVLTGNDRYTVHLVNSGTIADGLIEVYDFSRDNATRLSNVSCRLDMKAGETVILGTSLIANPVPVLARSIGPGLADYGIPLADTLPDPDVRVYAGATEIAFNEDWSAAIAPYFAAAGAFTLPAGSKDAAARVTFTQGGLTVHATGKGKSGIAIIELFESPEP